MQETHSIFKALATVRPFRGTVLACLYTGVSLPTACSPMSRIPAPKVGMPIEDLLSCLDAVLAYNPAVHDGAIMIGRHTPDTPYRITGWSYRLFPQSVLANPLPNRGSAFHSALSMSLEPQVDAMYLVTGGKAVCFTAGIASDV